MHTTKKHTNNAHIYTVHAFWSMRRSNEEHKTTTVDLTKGPPRFLPSRRSSRWRLLPPQFWGEIIFQRVSCSTHTQLFRPMSWGHHILEWWTTENTCGASIYHRFHPRASWIHTCLSCSLPVFHPAGGRPAPSLKFQKRIGIEMIKSWAGPAFRIFGSFSGSQEQTPSIRLLICNGDPQRILRGREDAYQWTTIKAMLAWFIFANVCDSLGNSEVSLSVNDDQGDASMIRLRQCV